MNLRHRLEIVVSANDVVKLVQGGLPKGVGRTLPDPPALALLQKQVVLEFAEDNILNCYLSCFGALGNLHLAQSHHIRSADLQILLVVLGAQLLQVIHQHFMHTFHDSCRQIYRSLADQQRAAILSQQLRRLFRPMILWLFVLD